MANQEIGPVVITAAGEGTRIRDFMSDHLELPPDYPKHLLPTGGPNGETLLGRIVQLANEAPLKEPPIVYVRPENMHYFEDAHDLGPLVMDTEKFSHAVDPIYHRVRRTGARVLGCAGDFFSDGFSWQEMIERHEEGGAAMSLFVERSPQPVNALVLDVDDESRRIRGSRRPSVSGEGEYTNVGAYIIDPY